MKAFLILSIFVSVAQASPKVIVSVTEFQNKVGQVSCDHLWYWWSDHLGHAFRDVLISEMAKNPRIQVVEREHINEIYANEHELVNSENDRSLKRGGFKKSKYTIVGSVTEYEFCSSENGGSVNIGRLAGLLGHDIPDVSLGLRKAKALVGIDLRLISTETGEVLKVAQGRGSQERQDFDFGSDVIDLSTAKSSPIGLASREAIKAGLDELIAEVK